MNVIAILDPSYGTCDWHDRYHTPDCGYIRRTREEHKVRMTDADARALGLVACKRCCRYESA